MDEAGEDLQTLRDARPRMQHRIIWIAEHAIVAHGGNRWIARPKTRWRASASPHLTVENDLRAHLDNVLQAEMRPTLRHDIGDIFRVGEVQQIVKEGARPNRDKRLMTNQHHDRARFHALEPRSHSGDVRVDRSEQAARRTGTTRARPDAFYAALDARDRIVIGGHRCVAH
jgi:hypothetical protein